MYISTDFNDASEQMVYEVIPRNTLAKVKLKIIPGNIGPDRWFTCSAFSGSIFLKIECTIIGGPYADRKIFHMIGIKSSKLSEDNTDKWAQMGRSTIRSILESARNINHNDDSEYAKQERILNNISELNGLEFAIKIGIKQDKSGLYDPQNTIAKVLTPNDKDYSTVMHSDYVDSSGSKDLSTFQELEDVPF